MKEPKIDKEFAGLHRRQNDSEYALLKEDIKHCRGLTDPILVWEEEEIVIDGHHRLKACKELKIKPIYLYLPFPGREFVIFYIKLHQAGRRNISPEEYGLCLLSLRVSCLALEKSGVNLPRLSIKAIAEMCNLSEKTLKKLNIINREGSEALKEAVKKKDKSVSSAHQELPSSQEKQKKKDEETDCKKTKECLKHEICNTCPYKDDCEEVLLVEESTEEPVSKPEMATVVPGPPEAEAEAEPNPKSNPKKAVELPEGERIPITSRAGDPQITILLPYKDYKDKIGYYAIVSYVVTDEREQEVEKKKIPEYDPVSGELNCQECGAHVWTDKDTCRGCSSPKSMGE